MERDDCGADWKGFLGLKFRIHPGGLYNLLEYINMSGVNLAVLGNMTEAGSRQHRVERVDHIFTQL